MNKLYDMSITVGNRAKFTASALKLIDISNKDVMIRTRTEKEFADSVAEDIKSLNDGYIDGVEIRLTCIEDLPYSAFSYSSDVKK